MADERRPESADLTDYQPLDSYDTLDGDPGDDPLDRGVIPPERWSAAMRTGTDGESLDQLLAEEEPEPSLGADEDWPSDDDPWPDESSDPRAGRLVAHDGGHHVRRQAELVAHDVGPDGGGATAEEAAVHVIDDIDSGEVLSSCQAFSPEAGDGRGRSGRPAHLRRPASRARSHLGGRGCPLGVCGAPTP
jgi:hypothetical protein